MQDVMAPKNLDKERGARLKAHRERLGLTQPQVAERIKRSKDIITRHEAGGGMEYDTAKAYAELYGTTVQSLLGDSSPSVARTPERLRVVTNGVSKRALELVTTLFSSGRLGKPSEDELEFLTNYLGDGGSEESVDLEERLMFHRAGRDKTDEAINAWRAVVRRQKKPTPSGRSPKPGGEPDAAR